ncbi:MAG TPA: helix-turn-helix domain-containing protein [Pseudonocardia sp.]|nr:helix-turn-helix domain-containing protein [Pseudonocardia sp.]
MDPRPRSMMLRTRDADEAQELAGAFLYPQRMDLLDRTTPLDLVMYAGFLGPIFIGDCAYGADIRIWPGELGSYHVNLPLSGHLVTTQRGRTVRADPDTAAVYRPTGTTVLDRWGDGGRMLCIKIDKAALESALADSLGRDAVEPVDFDQTLDVGTGAGRDWAELVRTVNGQLHREDGLLRQPLVAAPLAHGLLAGLLAAAGHQYRPALDEPAAPCRPPVVARALEYLHEHAADPITTADVAAHCWVSVRTLQEGFQRHVGRPPSAELRRIRLDRARTDLVRADPYSDCVAAIAHRWGFGHLGRFASAYEAEFGERPSSTLRAGS